MSERPQCTKENPMPYDAPYRKEYWQHPDAKEEDSTCDCCAAFTCPYCGYWFKCELPE